MTSPFPAGPWMDWNLEPWRPSPPLQLPPPQAWSPLLCDSNSRKWRKCWYSRCVLFFWALSSSFLLFFPTAVFTGPCLCVFRCIGGVCSLACVKLMPHLLSIHLSSVKEMLLKKKTQLCNQLDFYCEFYHYFCLPAITSVQVCALTLTAVSTGLGWHTWIIPPITDVWIRSCSWCFKGFKGVFVSL